MASVFLFEPIIEFFFPFFKETRPLPENQLFNKGHYPMKNAAAGCCGFFICLFLTSSSFSQDAIRPWEKYGLSQGEWKMVQDNKISLDKVRTILSAGISIGEYCQKPWKRLALTEGEWIEKRRAGLTSYDIELEAKSNRRRWRTDADAAAPSGYASFSSGGNQLVSFILPGFQQLRLKQTTRGRIMAGLAFASLAGCLAGVVIENRFEARPLYFVLAPDMLWSFIDFKITLGRLKKEPR
jgi:hypothetical protein